MDYKYSNQKVVYVCVFPGAFFRFQVPESRIDELFQLVDKEMGVSLSAGHKRRIQEGTLRKLSRNAPQLIAKVVPCCIHFEYQLFLDVSTYSRYSHSIM